MKAGKGDHLAEIKELYSVNNVRAEEYFEIINLIDGELQSIEERVFRGGKQ
jgi:Mg2+ and Co2+ transporter CorA